MPNAIRWPFTAPPPEVRRLARPVRAEAERRGDELSGHREGSISGSSGPASGNNSPEPGCAPRCLARISAIICSYIGHSGGHAQLPRRPPRLSLRRFRGGGGDLPLHRLSRRGAMAPTTPARRPRYARVEVAPVLPLAACPPHAMWAFRLDPLRRSRLNEEPPLAEKERLLTLNARRLSPSLQRHLALP